MKTFDIGKVVGGVNVVQNIIFFRNIVIILEGGIGKGISTSLGRYLTGRRVRVGSVKGESCQSRWHAAVSLSSDTRGKSPGR